MSDVLFLFSRFRVIIAPCRFRTGFIAFVSSKVPPSPTRFICRQLSSAFFFSRTSTSQLLDKPRSQDLLARCRPFCPPVLAFNLYRAYRVQQSHCSSMIHSSNVANSRSRASCKSICAQEKVPTNLYEYASLVGGLELTKTGLLYQARRYR